ncbi:MAG: hypothetical protein JW827_05475 [Spirochaetes bacterium]|nr:hypothetical protein [Spirochaetota bacterium]
MKYIYIIIILFFFITPGLTQEVELDDDSLEDAPVLNWPYERKPGFLNYAQELIFNKTKGEYYLKKAKAYYMAGLSGLVTYFGPDELEHFFKHTGIKWYEPDPSKSDYYLRDPYMTEILTPTGGSVLYDFILSEWYFTKSLDILARYVEWDADVATRPLFKNLLNNTFKSLVYCSVYVGNYEKALGYLQEYKRFNPDKVFVLEWEARIFGMIVDVAKEWDWSFVGDKKAHAWMKKHRKALIKALDYHYPGDSKTKEEIKKRIYPELIIEQRLEEAKPVQSTNQ